MRLSVDHLHEIIKDQFEYKLIEELAEVGQYKTAAVGSYLIRPGEYIRAVPFIIKGSV